MGRGTEKFTRKCLHWQRESDQEVSRIPWTEEREKYKKKIESKGNLNFYMEFPKILYSGLPSRWMVIYTRLCAHVT